MVKLLIQLKKKYNKISKFAKNELGIGHDLGEF